MRVKGLVLGSIFAGLVGCSGQQPSGTDSQAVRHPPPKVPQPANNYALFETLQVRPLAMTPDHNWLLACNTPDNKLEIFRAGSSGLHAVTSLPVGLEPIAVAARSNHEVWVVNHLSDSISIVALDDDFGTARVTRTLLVGDEPRDIVFGGPNHDRAFITTAHRGQNSPDDPGLFDPSQGRADVWVFDANNLGADPGGTRLAKLTLFADTPRALAVTPDGRTVYAAPFFSGNMTTAVSVDAVRNVYPELMVPTNPNIMLFYGTPQPITGLVVKYKLGSDGQYHWIDGFQGRNFDAWVKVSLPDLDVFAIDAAATPPAMKGAVPHVGTTLFNMAVNPTSGKVYVTNTEAHNDVRFEGNRTADHLPFTTVRGQEVDSRISVVDPSTGATVHNNLNSHVVNGVGDKTISRAFPQDLAFSSDGSTVYAVAQGSGKLVWYSSSSLESGTAAPSSTNQLTLSAGGPTGVVLDEAHGRAYVLTRFDDGISSVDLRTKTEVGHLKMYSPEPASVTAGRQYLYDCNFTSANGTQSCASCHVGGDMDHLAWDLGNPGASPLPITTAAGAAIFTIDPAAIEAFLPSAALLFAAYQPLKGPMTTQSLRGMDNSGAMHWRGDRNGAVQQSGVPFTDSSGNPVVSAQPNAGIYDEALGFESFNVAFPGLVGRDDQLSAEDMTAFRTFILQVMYPPNPIHNLDDSLTPIQAAGAQFFFNHAPDGTELPSDRFHNCNGCHTTDRNGNAGSTDHPGFFGTSGQLSFELESQVFKVPHLRNQYQKLGMFASSPDSNMVGTMLQALNPAFPDLNPPLPAVRGFGYQHDGVLGTLEHFFTGQVFIQIPVGQPAQLQGVTVPPNPFGVPFFTFDPTTKQITGLDVSGFGLRRAIVSYVLAFDSNHKPIVGQQVTLTAKNATAVASRLALLEAQAAAGNCDLVAEDSILGRASGSIFQNGNWVTDSTAVPPIPDATFRSMVGLLTDAITFTAVPVGSGWRIAVDRDADGFANLDEILLGFNPADPNSHP